VALESIPSHGGEFQEIFPWLITHTRGEEMGTAKSSQADWKDTRNMKQYSFFCPRRPPTIKMVMSLTKISRWARFTDLLENRYRLCGIKLNLSTSLVHYPVLYSILHCDHGDPNCN